jgi:hypothetical protein
MKLPYHNPNTAWRAMRPVLPQRDRVWITRPG